MAIPPASSNRTKEESKFRLDRLSAKGKFALEHILIAVFIFLTATIIAFGYISYQNYSTHFRRDIDLELATSADLKSSEISQYIKERMGNGGMLFRRDAFYSTVQRFFEHPEDSRNAEYLRKWMTREATHYQYDNASIVDTMGFVRIGIPKATEKPCCVKTMDDLRNVMRNGEVALGDFCRSTYDGRIYLEILVPILDENKDSPAIGILALRIDPEKYLYPFIKRWPVPSETAETLLVRREGNDVLFLNELRFQKNAALSLRFPIDANKDLPAVKAVLGQRGIITGRDYRGVPVVAYVRAVANSPWFMIARIDTSEAYAPMRHQLWSIMWLAIASIFVIGMTIWFFWRRHNLIFYKTQYEMAQALKASEERYRRLFEAAKDGVLLIDFDTGLILDVNPFLIKLLGYSRAEFLTKHLWDVGPFKNIIGSEESFAELRSKGYARYEDQPLETRSGKSVQVEFVSNVYTVGDKKTIQCNIRDITERRLLDAELIRARETQYKALIENLPQKVFLKDKNSVYISCNTNYAKDLKIKPEEIVGKTDHDFFPTHLAEKYRSDDRRVMDSGETENIEEEFVVIRDFLRGAEKTVVNTVKIPVRDKEGNIAGVFGLFWDITAHKRAQWEMAESEKKFKTVFDNASDGIVVADPRNKKFYMANNTICRMLGYSHDEIMKLGIADIHPEKSLSHVVDQFEKQTRGEISLAIGLPIKRKDGTVFYADINAVPVEISGKIYLAGFFRDITDRIKVDEERNLVLKWQRGVDSLQLMLLASAPLQDKFKIITDGVVQIFGADFCRIWMIKPGDLCEKGCIHAQVMEGPHICRYRDRCLHLISSSGRYTHIDGRAHARVPFGCYKIGLIASGEDHKFLTNDVVNDPRVHNHEWARELGLVSFAGYQLKIPNGETTGVMALFSKHPIAAAEDAILDSLSTTISFVVQQSIAEEERIRLLGIKASAEIKSQFASMVSHELRSPLAVIKESINLVLEELIGNVTLEQKDVLNTAKNNIDRLGRLINNVLDFQKIGAGKLDISSKEYDINELVLATSREMNLLAEEKGLSFTVNVDESIPGLKFDRDKIVQVITNLISNAIKFTEKGSVSVSTEREDNTAHVVVEDTGLGIQVEDMPKLFQTFEQLGGGLGKKRGGTGLGLAISKEIIQAHNGKIWAESQFGKGSKFHFTLPIKERRG
ncbi:MAG: PAS domain S-box protein [Candidatus Omnitrophica bacterium]|nr:PAS domain S-box protein [Candidatus Omnitrophota bacterium]